MEFGSIIILLLKYYYYWEFFSFFGGQDVESWNGVFVLGLRGHLLCVGFLRAVRWDNG